MTSSVPHIEIHCPACGVDAFLLRESVYEGLRKTGERLKCSACGHGFASEEDAPRKFTAPAAPVFSDEDRPAAPRVFDQTTPPLCRHCRFYVVNPFTQWCSHHRREVEAMDSCPDFQKQLEDAPPPI